MSDGRSSPRPRESSCARLQHFVLRDAGGRRVFILNEKDTSPLPCPTPLAYPAPASPPPSTPGDTTPYRLRSGITSSRRTSSVSLPSLSDIESTIDYHRFDPRRSRTSSVSSGPTTPSSYAAWETNGARDTPFENPKPKNARRSSASAQRGRKYQCPACGKPFTTSGHVSRHFRIHTGEKKYTCPKKGCGQRFSRQDNCMYAPNEIC
jgi:uncharacterized Zn-finger protein